MQLMLLLLVSICAASTTAQAACRHGTVKLVNQTSMNTSFGLQYKGIIAICINGRWSLICSSQWSHADAKVACIDMGYSEYGSVAFPLSPLSNKLPVSISSISCRGDEVSVLECPMSVSGGTGATDGEAIIDDSEDNILIGNSSDSGSGSDSPAPHCPTSTVAGIICQTSSNKNHSNCDTGELQLNNETGRLEVCINNQWGGVCHENWTSNETLVAYKKLSMNCPSEAVRVRSLPRGSDLVFYRRFTCSGREGNLLECSNEIDHTLSSCGSTGTTVGLFCTGAESDYCDVNGSIRLVPGYNTTNTSDKKGIVQICFNQTWKVICASSWTAHEASIVCQQIGFSAYGALPKYMSINVIPKPLQEFGKPVNCNGTENKLSDCIHQTSPGQTCRSNIYAGVECQEKCSEGRIDSIVENKPRFSDATVFLIVCMNEIRRPIHDTNWTFTDASVICATAGFPKYGARPVFRVSSNKGVPGLNVQCNGNETKITDCSRGPLMVSNDTMMGAICHTTVNDDDERVGEISRCTNGQLRLVTVTGALDPSRTDGIIQMCVNGIWKPLCHDDTINDSTYWQIGAVICNQLGLGEQYIAPEFKSFNRHGIRLDFNCHGNESSLLECARTISERKYRQLKCRTVTHIHCDKRSDKPKAEVNITSLTPKSLSVVVTEYASIPSVNFTCTATGSTSLSIKWQFIATDLTVTNLRPNLSSNTFNGSELISVLTLRNPTPADNGIYSCTVWHNGFYVTEEMSNLTIKVPPVVEIESRSYVKEGTDTVVRCTGRGYPSPLLSLTKNGYKLPLSSTCYISTNDDLSFPGIYRCNLSYALINVSMSDAGSYSCEASTDGVFPVQHKSRHLAILGMPKVVKKPASKIIYSKPSSPGAIVNLTCIIKGLPLPVIDWYKITEGTFKSLIKSNTEHQWITTWSPSNFTVQSSLLIKNVNIEDHGIYGCIGANSLGSVKTEASLSVHTDHLVSIQVLPSPVLLEGSKLTLLCDAYPSEVAGSSNFTWTKNKQPLTQKSYQRNSLQNEITLKSVSISDSGKYTCIYQTSTGKTFTAFVFIKVEARLKIQLKAKTPLVDGKKLWLVIKSNKPTSGIQCTVGRLTKDCSSGKVLFDGVSCIHDAAETRPVTLRVNATSPLGEVSLIVRKFYIDSPLLCSAYLINSGVSISGNTVTAEFAGLGPIRYYQCSLDSNRPHLCKSPLVLKGVPAGYHTLTIRPRGCYNRVEKLLTENFILV